MKQTLTIFLLLNVFVAFAQDESPVLIYSCMTGNYHNPHQYEILSSSGKKIFNHSVDWVHTNSWGWLFVVNNISKLTRLYDLDGKELGIDSINYGSPTDFDLNRAALKRNGKWGYYDRQGKLKIAHLYDDVSHFTNNKAAVKLGEVIFLIDTNGVKTDGVYDPKDTAYFFNELENALQMGTDVYSNNFKKIVKNGKVGLLDKSTNKLVIPIEYDKLVDIQEKHKMITAGKNGKWGVLAFGGRVVIPLEYKEVFVIYDAFAELHRWFF